MPWNEDLKDNKMMLEIVDSHEPDYTWNTHPFVAGPEHFVSCVLLDASEVQI
jgi:hypothetical protein